MMRRSRTCSRRSAPATRPRLLVLNKADLLDELGRVRAVNGHRDALLVSARDRGGPRRAARAHRRAS